ncbi:SGNH/GDSL hydrolase family protein [Bifidobacterium sp. ESL0704]|uniref:SGNH/GDSL hydrolase family protein n=1 Tax=Bifidobacterium sp. ESL0704 TaxID=2983219 RepID=UPI0023F8B08A|nr:SGNH/GDSL hydrolase family protein [Bifidobacterium sp. ESL0704]WEV53284.1 SGNH/GDSL hydrolase family protein [Bifidobacterium sp. ESL0704]
MHSCIDWPKRYKDRPFADYVLNCFGDSTTWGDNGVDGGSMQTSWPSFLEKNGLFKTVRNYGVCGSRVALTDDRDDSFFERYRAMKDDDVDVITLMGGVNDFQHDVPLGILGVRDERTFYGAFDIVLSGIIEQAPEASVVVFTPTANMFHNPAKNYPTSLQPNARGLHQKDYVEAVKKVSEHYAVPVVDLYASSGMCPFVEQQQVKNMPDGLHYSVEGYARLARRIYEELLHLA